MISFVIPLVFRIFLGKAWAEGKGELATCPPPRGQRMGKMDKMYAAIV